MTNKIFFRFLVAFCLFFSFSVATLGENNISLLKPVRLQVNNLESPMIAAGDVPEFSWSYSIPERDYYGLHQTSYRILVADSKEKLEQNEGNLWDTGKKLESRQMSIKYEGEVLPSHGSFFWKVRVWDEKDNASEWSPVKRFTTAFEKGKGWGRAEWITAEQNLLTPGEIRNGAESPVLKESDTRVELIIDLGKSRRINGVKFWPAAPPVNNVEPGYGFPVRFYIEGAENCDFASSILLADYREKDVVNPVDKPVDISFLPAKVRYVRLVTTELYRIRGGNEMQWDQRKRKFYFDVVSAEPHPEESEYRFALSEMEVFSGGENVAEGKEADLNPEQENSNSGWSEEFITDGRQQFWVDERFAKSKVSLFRKEFNWNGDHENARLYISALGLYDARINGKPVTKTLLNPGFSVYDAFVPYRGYDVSPYLRNGKNEITILVGDGWYRKPSWNDRFLQKRKVRGFPDRPVHWLIAQLEISDGKEKTVIGTDETWQVTQQHPWREANLHFGAKYDATYREPSIEWFHHANTAVDKVFPELIPDERPPVIIRDRMKPVRIWQAGHNRVMVDFGRQLTGAVKLTGTVPSETKLKIIYTEALTDKNEPYLRNQAGRSENGDEYVLLPGTEYNLRPLFTYHGFRYVEVTWEGDSALFNLPLALNMEALVYSNELLKTAKLHSSDERINRLTQMIDETFRNNLVSLITDVAGRDERAFWLGDCFTTPIQSLCYLFDFAAMGRSLFKLMEKSMHMDGIGTVPDPGAIFTFVRNGNRSTPGYSDASVVVPNTLFMNYNDNFARTTGWKYADVYTGKVLNANESPLPSAIYKSTWIGDWLSNRMTIPPDATSWEPGGAGALSGIFDAYWWNRVLKESANLAMANGDAEEAEFLINEAEKLREAAISKFTGENGKVEGEEQSSYALLLNLTERGSNEEKMIFRQLLRAIEDYENHLATGTLSHLPLLKALSERGYQDLALQMMMQPHPPSFGYMVDFGSSTVWERLDSRHPRLGINPANMNGLNHIGQNSVYEWLFEQIGGIQVLPEHPGWEKFRVSPLLFEDIHYAEATLQSPRGEIVCRLEKKNDETVQLQLTVPPNSVAEVDFNGWIPESVSATDSKNHDMINQKLHNEGSLERLEIPAGVYVIGGKMKKHSKKF